MGFPTVCYFWHEIENFSKVLRVDADFNIYLNFNYAPMIDGRENSFPKRMRGKNLVRHTSKFFFFLRKL